MLDFMTHLTNENHKGLYTVPFFKEKTLWNFEENLKFYSQLSYFCTLYIYIYIHRQCQSKCFSCLKQEECLSATRNVQCSV